MGQSLRISTPNIRTMGQVLCACVRRLVPRCVKTPVINAQKSIKNYATLSFGYGQALSIRTKSCVNQAGRPIPWYTYPSIDYLECIDFSQKNIFEYGSGNSSLWWSARSKSVTSVESDPAWFDRVKSQIGADCPFDYRLATTRDDYIHQDAVDLADVIIIDGIYRPECVDVIVDKVKAGAFNPDLIIFDNSDWYPSTIRRLNAALTSHIQVDFSGFGPINNYTWTTTLFIAARGLSHASALRPIGGNHLVSDDDR